MSHQSNPTLTASLANGRARLSTGPFDWDSDLAPALGGYNEAPSPVAYLLGVDGTDPALSEISVEIPVSSPSPSGRVAAMQEACGSRIKRISSCWKLRS